MLEIDLCQANCESHCEPALDLLKRKKRKRGGPTNNRNGRQKR